MNSVRLAIDVESGDFGPRVIVSGILEARLSNDHSFKVFICGNRPRIERVIDENNAADQLGDYEIIECNDIINPGERRAGVWKKQKSASIIRCITLQKERLVDASISAGDTAILMGAALFILGRSEGALRPALAAFLPTVKKKPVLLLDVGANLNCRAEHLVSFAIMGDRYISRFLDMPSPAITLLSIGKEAAKGTRTISDAEKILKERFRNYRGFIEGNDVLAGESDIVVCDGFCGNVLLKACESFHRLAESVLGDQMTKDAGFRKKMAILDPENYGGVPLLGIKGTVLKAHGRSSSRAIANSINAAIIAVKRHAVWESEATERQPIP
ncbi:MAG: phosphate acyltransferase PlsX [Chitinispirillaceae bacterium]|nr:phosphate acyltransferase PlsX [Chitinispirillaceae bacterium]